MAKAGYLTDFKKIQRVSGIAATTGVIMTLATVFLFPLSAQAIWNIIYVSVGTLVFNIVYYLVPKFYLSKKWAFIPDIVYVTAIALVMRNLGDYGSVYFLLYMILAAVDAFIFPLQQYILVMLIMFTGVFFASHSSFLNFSPQSIFQVYGLATLAVILHLIARDAISVKEKKETLEIDMAKLEKDKEEIKNILQSLSDGMFVVNAEDKITFFNKSALETLGIVATESKILGKDISNFLKTIGAKGPEQVTKEVKEEKEQSIRNDFRIVLPERTIKLHTNVSPVVISGKYEGAIIFFRDITKEKRIEEQQAEFNAIASHELRTPLTVIEGYLYFLLDPASKAKYDKTTKEYIEKAHESSQDLISLITDILTVVRTDEGELDVTIKKADLGAIVKEVAKDYKKEARKKNIELKTKIAAKVPMIQTDPVKVREILTNLVENAVKFTEEGSVTVELGQLAKEALISVTDTGIGIDTTDQKSVFNKFFRSENWKTRKSRGTGLGLYIARTLTERLGGRIGLTSEPQKGSKFYITLPLEYRNENDMKKKPKKSGPFV